MVAVTDRMSSVFNDLMKNQIKGPFSSGKHRSFWDMLVSDGLTLVTTEEEGSSDVTSAQASVFLEEEKEVVVVPTVVAMSEPAEDDPFGDME